MQNNKLVALSLITIVTCMGTIIHGRSSQRWGVGQGMLEAGNQLSEISQQVPGWRLESSGRIADTSRKMLESTGDIVRAYRDPISGAAVNVSVIIGPPGTISVHSPEICLPSRNFDLLGERQEVTIRDAAGVEHRFWKVGFESKDASAQLLYVYYAWSDGGAWTATESPRYSFVGSPYLYKIQLAGYTPLGGESDEQSVTFLREFLPQVSRELVSAATSHLPSHDEE